MKSASETLSRRRRGEELLEAEVVDGRDDSPPRRSAPPAAASTLGSPDARSISPRSSAHASPRAERDSARHADDDLQATAAVCKKWRLLTTSPSFWECIVKRRWHINRVVNPRLLRDPDGPGAAWRRLCTNWERSKRPPSCVWVKRAVAFARSSTARHQVSCPAAPLWLEANCQPLYV